MVYTRKEKIQMIKNYLVAVKNYIMEPTKVNEDAMLGAREIIITVIGVYVLASLLPSAVASMNAANTSGWTATQIAIWGVTSIVILAVVIMKIAE